MTAIINITITITIMIIGIMMINCKKLKKENSPVTLISISSAAPACAAVLRAVRTLHHQDYHDVDDHHHQDGVEEDDDHDVEQGDCF